MAATGTARNSKALRQAIRAESQVGAGRLVASGVAWSRNAWAKRLKFLALVVDGDPRTWQESRTTLPDGRVQVTVTAPSAKERREALKELGRLGGVDRALGDGGAGHAGSLADQVKALQGALSDPAVRGWLERTQPEVLQALRLLSAQPVPQTPALAMPEDGEVSSVEVSS